MAFGAVGLVHGHKHHITAAIVHVAAELARLPAESVPALIQAASMRATIQSARRCKGAAMNRAMSLCS
jgi:hypothetical protein